MRRIAALLTVVLLVLSMACPVLAATGASSVQGFATVSNDGSCQISLNITLHLEYVVKNLTFPVPANARNIMLNGSAARVSRSGGVAHVDLSRIVGKVVGDFIVSISYSVPDLVQLNEDGTPELRLPLLSGFAYPVEKLQFTVSMPGAVEARPVFLSGYYQQDIESSMEVSVSGNTISGTVNTQLKDLETFTVVLDVTQEMFPHVVQSQWRSSVDNIAMWVLAGAAVVYWVVFLRCLPSRRVRCTTPPEGFTAGQMGSLLTGQGADLTLMVFTWASLGYILIQMPDHNRVILHKRMDMGNERSMFEQKLFRKLFGKRRMVDSGSFHYAELCRAAAATSGNTKALYRKGHGNRKILRFICVGIGLFCGISLGNAMAGNAVLGGLLAFLFAVLCAGASWLIQDWIRGLHLHGRDSLYLALACAGIWLLFAGLAGDLHISAAVVAGQFLSGLFCGYGGRRNESGQQLFAQVLGLRRYFRTVESKHLHDMVTADQDYFFTLAPYAMALGSCEHFAWKLGSKRHMKNGCPYLTTGMDGQKTALEWYRVLRRAANVLDARQKRLLLERLTAR